LDLLFLLTLISILNGAPSKLTIAKNMRSAFKTYPGYKARQAKTGSVG